MSAKTHVRGQDWQGGRTRCGKVQYGALTLAEEDALPTCAQCIKGGLADAKAGDQADIHPGWRVDKKSRHAS